MQIYSMGILPVWKSWQLDRLEATVLVSVWASYLSRGANAAVDEDWSWFPPSSSWHVFEDYSWICLQLFLIISYQFQNTHPQSALYHSEYQVVHPAKYDGANWVTPEFENGRVKPEMTVRGKRGGGPLLIRWWYAARVLGILEYEWSFCRFLCNTSNNNFGGTPSGIWYPCSNGACLFCGKGTICLPSFMICTVPISHVSTLKTHFLASSSLYNIQRGLYGQSTQSTTVLCTAIFTIQFLRHQNLDFRACGAVPGPSRNSHLDRLMAG